MYLLLLFLPLWSFLCCLLAGRKLGHYGVQWLPCILMGFATICSWILFWDVVILDCGVHFILWNWFNTGTCLNMIHFVFDQVTLSMLVLVLTVSSLVHLYSTAYMNEDPHLPRFMGYLSLFTFFMVVLVTADNLVQLFIGWEGVGLCSYLLINFWFTRIQANKAAIKAMVLNKIGDIGLLIAMISLYYWVGGWDYISIFCISFWSYENIGLTFIGCCLLLGVIGKSAQFGLHTWLPDAMEGPTPVSALIHAATMVTAGVFLLIRLSPFFECLPTTLLFIIIIGSITAFFASTIGIAQNDLKKVIAYSTCSQLGYMVMICGFSQYSLGLFHLINHGFFKALLFLSAGSVIHAVLDEQDIRKGGGLNSLLPFSYVCILIGSLSLMGLPFLTGFYSKDLILELVFGSHIYAFAFWLALLSASITAFYSFRLIYYSFHGNMSFGITIAKKVHEGTWNLIIPLWILLILSIMGGFGLHYVILKDIKPVLLPELIKWGAFIVSLFGASVALIISNQIYQWKYVFIQFYRKNYDFLNKAWYVDPIWTTFITVPFLRLGLKSTYMILDQQWLEKWGPRLTYPNVVQRSNQLSYYHRGEFSFYLLFALVFFILLFLNS